MLAFTVMLETFVKGFGIDHGLTAVLITDELGISTEVVAEAVTVGVHDAGFVWDDTLEALLKSRTSVAGQGLFYFDSYILIYAVSL